VFKYLPLFYYRFLENAKLQKSLKPASTELSRFQEAGENSLRQHQTGNEKRVPYV